MRERDPEQRAVDEAVIDAAEKLRDEAQEALAVQFNHAFVAAHGGKAG